MAELNPNPTARDDEKQGKEEGDKHGKGKGKLEGEGSGEGSGSGSGSGSGFLNCNRHRHDLLLSEDLPVYTCSGCKEPGTNTGYRCKSGLKCENFILHVACAILPDDIEQPSGSKRKFKFRKRTKLVHNCSGCQEKLGGFVFETENRDVRLHPLCLVLPKLLDYSEHAEHADQGLKIVTGDLKGKEYTCSHCNHVITSGGWRYKCSKCKFYVDPSCAKEEIFGLPENAIHSKSGGKRKTAAVFLKAIIKEAVETLINAIIGGAASELFQNQSSEQQ